MTPLSAVWLCPWRALRTCLDSVGVLDNCSNVVFVKSPLIGCNYNTNLQLWLPEWSSEKCYALSCGPTVILNELSSYLVAILLAYCLVQLLVVTNMNMMNSCIVWYVNNCQNIQSSMMCVAVAWVAWRLQKLLSWHRWVSSVTLSKSVTLSVDSHSRIFKY